MVSGWAGGRAGGGKKFGTFVRMCRCATSWSDPDLTFDLATVNLSLKILSKLYLGNRKVWKFFFFFFFLQAIYSVYTKMIIFTEVFKVTH